MNTYDVEKKLNYLERAYRDICCKIKSCLGIKSTGDENKFLSEKGNWIKPIILPIEGEIIPNGDDYFFGNITMPGIDAFGMTSENLYLAFVNNFGLFFGKLGIDSQASIDITQGNQQITITLLDDTNNFTTTITEDGLSMVNNNLPNGEKFAIKFDNISHNVISDWIAKYNFIDDAAAATGGVDLKGIYHNNGALRIRLT